MAQWAKWRPTYPAGNSAKVVSPPYNMPAALQRSSGSVAQPTEALRLKLGLPTKERLSTALAASAAGAGQSSVAKHGPSRVRQHCVSFGIDRWMPAYRTLQRSRIRWRPQDAMSRWGSQCCLDDRKRTALQQSLFVAFLAIIAGGWKRERTVRSAHWQINHWLTVRRATL